jgi:GT2 family glycosyltransferase
LETIQGLADYFETHIDVGAATCKLVLADGSLDMDAHRAFPTPWISFTKIFGLNKLFPNSAFFNGYFMPDKNLNEPHEIDLLISHFMYTRKSLLEKLGGFDEQFFLYGEDVDICYRIKEAGWKIMYLPQWSAKHLKGASLGIRSTTRKQFKQPLAHRLKMQKLSAEAMELFLIKHYLKKYPKFLVYFMIFSTRILGKFRVFLESFR